MPGPVSTCHIFDMQTLAYPYLTHRRYGRVEVSAERHALWFISFHKPVQCSFTSGYFHDQLYETSFVVNLSRIRLQIPAEVDAMMSSRLRMPDRSFRLSQQSQFGCRFKITFTCTSPTYRPMLTALKSATRLFSEIDAQA